MTNAEEIGTGGRDEDFVAPKTDIADAKVDAGGPGFTDSEMKNYENEKNRLRASQLLTAISDAREFLYSFGPETKIEDFDVFYNRNKEDFKLTEADSPLIKWFVGNARNAIVPALSSADLCLGVIAKTGAFLGLF